MKIADVATEDLHFTNDMHRPRSLQLLLLIITALDLFIYNSAVRHARPETHELAMCQNNAVPMLFPRSKRFPRKRKQNQRQNPATNVIKLHDGPLCAVCFARDWGTGILTVP